MSERGEPHSDPALKDSIRARVVQIMDTWRRGSRPDARQVLEMHPDLWSEPSAVLDLALAEYRLRRAAGEQVDTTRFAAQFSTYADYVKRILSVERALPDLDLEIRWPEPGDSYLEFKLLWLLGVGAVGRVYLARQETIADRPVALKLTPFGYDEAQTLGKLHHNNIVPVLSVHKDEKTGLAGVCMPYLGTSTLQEVVRLAWRKRENREQEPTPPLSVLAQAVACPDGIEPPEAPFGERPLWEWCADYWEAVIHIGAGLCEGLAYVHSKGILHLDLKPSNVLLSPTGRPMLLDFNLAQDPARRAARLGGTVPYMAPEHFQQAFLAGPRDDHHQQLDARADLYSLGAVLFELCTGRLPHESTAGNFNDYLEEIALSHLRGAPPVRRVNSHVPEGLALLIDACLQTELAQRPASAEWLRDQLLGLLGPQASKPGRHRRAAWVALAATATAGLLIGTVAWYSGAWHLLAPKTASTNRTPTSTNSTAPSLESRIARALQAEREGNYSEAARLFTEILHEDASTLWQEHYTYCLVQLRDYQAARVQLQLIIQKEPNTAKHQNNLGYVLLRKNDIARAVWYFKKAIELDPNMYQPYCNLVVCLSQLPAIEPADAQWVDRALELAPANNYRLYIHAAAVYRRLRNADAAQSDLWDRKVQQCLDIARQLGCPEAIMRAHPNRQMATPTPNSSKETDLDQLPSVEFVDYYIPPGVDTR